MTNEIDLKLRYPESRLEDVTDAFMRGYQSCLETQPNTAWVKWLESLQHDEVKTIGDAVEQLMYEVIEFGGDMGPNGNIWNGVDEGNVLTAGFINEWIERFENMLGQGTCEVECFDDGMDEGIDGEWFAYAPATWHLSCGHEVYGSERPRYCPACGKRVVE